MHIIAGVDLAWMGTKNPTAIAVGKVESGVVELSEVLRDLKGTQAVIDALDRIEDLHGVAIDGPLIIKNQTGQRECERNIGVAYGARKASCHTSNLDKFPDAAGTQLSSHLEAAGFQHLGPTNQKWQLECYPHPALIEIFGLPERLAYKKGTLSEKRSGQIELAKLIMSLEESTVLRLRMPDEFRAYVDAGRISALGGSQLKHNEDVLDAIVCMYIGALYQSGQGDTVFGTREDGYIYVPTRKCISGQPLSKPPSPTHFVMSSPTLNDSAFDRPITLRDAYRIMERFANDYLARGDTSISDFLYGYAGECNGGATTDPAAVQDFLRVAEGIIGAG